jgi:uncharacterized protein YecT (DUF1311 family)
MTITRQQVDAWDAEVNAAYERSRQEGMKQERALWELTKVGQEIEAQPARTGWPEGLLQDDDRKLSKWLASKPDAKHIVDMAQRPWVGLTAEERNEIWRKEIGWGDPSHNDEDLMKTIEAKLKDRNT